MKLILFQLQSKIKFNQLNIMSITPTTPLDQEINQALAEFQANIAKGLYLEQPLQHIVDDLNIQRLMITRMTGDFDNVRDVLNAFDKELRGISQILDTMVKILVILEQKPKKEGFWSKFKGLFK